MSTRIFVGGLPAGITKEELAQRFTTFGDVQDCELVPNKVYTTLHINSKPEEFSRNFGYVSLVPKDDKSVNKAVGLYNGTRWRGTVLRCQVARESVTERLEKEKIEEENERLEALDNTEPILSTDDAPLRIRNPFNREVVTVPRNGAPIRTEKLATIGGNSQSGTGNNGTTGAPPQKLLPSWAPIETGKLTFEEHLRNVTVVSKPQEEEDVWANPDIVPLSGLMTRPAPPRKNQQNLKRPAPGAAPGGASGVSDDEATISKPAPVPQPPAQRIRTVEFMSKADVAEAAAIAAQAPRVDLSRFGSESDSGDEQGPLTLGVPRRSTRSIIPQVDGTADSSDSDSQTSGSDSGSESDSDEENGGSEKSGEKNDGNGTSSDTSSENKEENTSDSDTSDTSSNDSEGEEETGEKGSMPEGTTAAVATNGVAKKKGANKRPAVEDDDEEELPDALETKGEEQGNEDTSWMNDILPAGASFFRTEPLVQVEAAWRAKRDSATRENKERRRQALRQAGRRSGGAKRTQ